MQTRHAKNAFGMIYTFMLIIPDGEGRHTLQAKIVRLSVKEVCCTYLKNRHGVANTWQHQQWEQLKDVSKCEGHKLVISQTLLALVLYRPLDSKTRQSPTSEFRKTQIS